MNHFCKCFDLTISLEVGDVILENVSEFCYLGHTIFNDGRNSTNLPIAKTNAKFHELSDVLHDQEIHLSIRQILEAFVKTRLTYAT